MANYPQQTPSPHAGSPTLAMGSGYATANEVRNGLIPTLVPCGISLTYNLAFEAFPV